MIITLRIRLVLDFGPNKPYYLQGKIIHTFVQSR